jgi:hypothetical protein
VEEVDAAMQKLEVASRTLEYRCPFVVPNLTICCAMCKKNPKVISLLHHAGAYLFLFDVVPRCACI